ncbi:ectonucleotide pyrophosphatase/phosphodiesterase [Terriglobus roseus]|uniref:Alkaline phosphatase D n=1 Tax=Terriglobus roseus TaxID=392734 RepID=A0A1H4KR61_9BACT|nr:ectonucleotide pyrophosphatase/phosphodiesterase [Terriglobus roseus]SEB60588.1 alkaline phosphatase D [Terriglobus roseus]
MSFVSCVRSFILAGVIAGSFLPLKAVAQHTAYGSVTPRPDMIVDTGGAPNDAHALKQHYVVLVSLDGFRYSYPKDHGAPYLQGMMKQGATAPDGMIPAYPSLTFPNHWTLVTGLYPEHHGLVRNSFYDPERKQSYRYTDPVANSDGSWYGGVPLWSLAEQQGMRAATFMWPGSEAEVAGHRPTMYAKFQDYLDGHVGLDQISKWLRLPAAERPHLMTLYLSATDHAGHWYGPDSEQEHEAVHVVDGLMSELRSRLDRSGLPVDLVIVSDHGMVQNDNDWVNLDQYADLSHTVTSEWLMYPDSEAEKEKVYESFKAHPDKRFEIYRQKDVPERLHYTGNPRIGDPVIVANVPIIVHPSATGVARADLADHGYDVAKVPQMKSFFLAIGPDIRKDVKLPSFDNVDVYSFIAKLLDLNPGRTDGEVGPLKAALKR